MCCARLNKDFDKQNNKKIVDLCEYCGKIISQADVEEYDCTMQKLQTIKKHMRNKWSVSNDETVRLYKQYAKSVRVFDNLELTLAEKQKHFDWLKEREELVD